MILYIFIVLVSLSNKQPNTETTISRKEPKESKFKALKQQVRDSRATKSRPIFQIAKRVGGGAGEKGNHDLEEQEDIPTAKKLVAEQDSIFDFIVNKFSANLIRRISWHVLCLFCFYC